ncbi:MAG: ribonuclease P protein subunit [Candidatus Nanoarchaeia archaeon]
MTIKVISSSNKSLDGLTGRVVDETKNMLMIETDNKIRKVLKKEVKLQINTQEGVKTLQGSDLIGCVSERLKKKDKVKSRW